MLQRKLILLLVNILMFTSIINVTFSAAKLYLIEVEHSQIIQFISSTWLQCCILLSVYSPFSERVGLPLHNILSPFLPLMVIFSVNLRFCHNLVQHSLPMSLVFQSVFCLHL